MWIMDAAILFAMNPSLSSRLVPRKKCHHFLGPLRSLFLRWRQEWCLVSTQKLSSPRPPKMQSVLEGSGSHVLWPLMGWLQSRQLSHTLYSHSGPWRPLTPRVGQEMGRLNPLDSDFRVWWFGGKRIPRYPRSWEGNFSAYEPLWGTIMPDLGAGLRGGGRLLQTGLTPFSAAQGTSNPQGIVRCLC